MAHKNFDTRKFDKLNNPQRLKHLPPEYFKEKLQLSNVGSIIDIGAGTGLFSREFSKLYPGSRIYAADISPLMVNYIKEKVMPDYPNIRALQMSDYHAPLQDASADLVIMINLHHEIDEPETMLKECYRLLRSGGRILISDWKKIKTDHGPAIENRYEVPQVEDQLRSQGFLNITGYDDLMQNFTVLATRP